MPARGGSGRRRGAGAVTLLLVVVLAVAAFGAGFLWFVNLTEANDGAPPGNADGIVALTGGPFRINDALELLAAGRAQRLLITGVNPVTRPVEISRLVPEHQRWFTCCVDIDHSTNTIGNAVETAALGEVARLQVADRRHRELSHAARHGRARP